MPSHDGLIIVIRGHGDEGVIFDSKGKRIPLTLLHDMVSAHQDPRFEQLPRIFIVDACRGSKGGNQDDGDDEKQAQGNEDKARSMAKVWKKEARGGQRKNLLTIYGNVRGFVTFASRDAGLLSAAVIAVLKQNARRRKQLASLGTDIREELNEASEGCQIAVIDGDASLNPLWIQPNHKRFPQGFVH